MKQEPVPITGLHLDAHSGRIKVSVELNGKWVMVLDEPQHDQGHISHIVEPSGILLCEANGRPR